MKDAFRGLIFIVIMYYLTFIGTVFGGDYPSIWYGLMIGYFSTQLIEFLEKH